MTQVTFLCYIIFVVWDFDTYFVRPSLLRPEVLLLRRGDKAARAASCHSLVRGDTVLLLRCHFVIVGCSRVPFSVFVCSVLTIWNASEIGIEVTHDPHE